MSEFRGLDYNKLKEDYIGKTASELEDQLYLCAIKANKLQNEGKTFEAIEYMARLALIAEVSEEIGK